MSLKRTHLELRTPGYKVSPDEMDFVRQYVVLNPSVDPVWFGTAVGTAGQVKALGVINKNADYPRNVVAAVASAAGSIHGGTMSITGKDQFGKSISESIAIGTATGGGTAAGTKIFSQVTAGTFNIASADDAGNATARLGVAIGTSASLQHYFGLPDKIGAVTDVKSLNWINNGTNTTFNGGSVSSTYVSTAKHAFSGSAVVAVTDRFVVGMKSSFNSEEDTIQNL